MQKTGVVAVIFMLVTYCAGLRCYNCTYTDDGTGNPVGDPSCQDDGVSKFKIEDCPTQLGNNIPLCTFFVSNKTIYDKSKGRYRIVEVGRGCSSGSSEIVPGCHYNSNDFFGRESSFNICRCKTDLCPENEQTRNYPAILTYTLAIGFLVLATEK